MQTRFKNGIHFSCYESLPKGYNVQMSLCLILTWDAMSRSGQRQGYVMASICKATPLPGKSPLAAQLISSFGDSFSNLVCTSSRKYLARLKTHNVRIYESYPTVSLSPRLAVQVPPILVSNFRLRKSCPSDLGMTRARSFRENNFLRLGAKYNSTIFNSVAALTTKTTATFHKTNRNRLTSSVDRQLIFSIALYRRRPRTCNRSRKHTLQRKWMIR